MSKHPTLERYAQPLNGMLTDEEIDRANISIAHMKSLSHLEDWAKEKTVTFERQTSGLRYQMLVDRHPEGDPNKVVMVGGEFGNGITPAVAARGRVIRDIVAPEATLVVQPNSTLFEKDHMNYSLNERIALRRGSLEPFVGRIAGVLYALQHPEDVTLFGPSQGATVMIGYAASPDAPDGVATAVLEAPNVVSRSSFKLVKDFVGSGNELKDVIGENFRGHDNFLKEEIQDNITLPGFVRFAGGLATQRNRVLRGILRNNHAFADMSSVLNRGGSVVHAWGTAANVSPVPANREIRNALSISPLYRGFELPGSDHSVTNNYILCGALAKGARNLLHPTLAEKE